MDNVELGKIKTVTGNLSCNPIGDAIKLINVQVNLEYQLDSITNLQLLCLQLNFAGLA